MTGVTGKLGLFVIIKIGHKIMTFITTSAISAAFPSMHSSAHSAAPVSLPVCGTVATDR